MLDYLMVLRMRYVQNLSSREICRTIGCGKTTVNDFIKRFGNCVDLSFPLESSVDNETIHRMLYKDKALRSEDFALPDFEKIYRSIPKKGETLKRIWRQYSRQTNQGSLHAYSYRQFCHLYDKWLDVRNVTAPITRYPAQNTELDYAGKSMWLKNKLTGESDTRVTVFLATMSYSNHTYGEGLTNCGIANWIGVNNHAVRFFGGTTPLTTNDNCKVAVIQNKDWIDPTLNRDFKDWADHFHTYLAPARVRAPRWKPNVENSVGVVTSHILIEMEEMTFFTLDEFNSELWRRIDEMNEAPFSKKPGSRKEMFEREERDLLIPLPSMDYEYMERTLVKSCNDYHVRFDHSFYSIPSRLVKQTVEIRATVDKVRIHTEAGTEACCHRRATFRGQWMTDPSHLPAKYQEYALWSVPYFQEWADRIGPHTKTVIDRQITSVEIPVQSFRKCIGILSFAKRYSPKTLEACCGDAVSNGRLSYSYIKDTIADYGEKRKKQEGPPPNGVKTDHVYRADSSKYSLDALLKAKEVE